MRRWRLYLVAAVQLGRKLQRDGHVTVDGNKSRSCAGRAGKPARGEVSLGHPAPSDAPELVLDVTGASAE